VPIDDPVIRLALDAAAEILRECADRLSDEACDRSAALGLVGHHTPGRVIRLYELADRVEGWPG
jgi:hypothetical protein